MIMENRADAGANCPPVRQMSVPTANANDPPPELIAITSAIAPAIAIKPGWGVGVVVVGGAM